MNTEAVCVNNCSENNRKRKVNTTSNRLVKESCGHTKCMKCLFKESSGCLACLKENKNGGRNVKGAEEAPVAVTEVSENAKLLPRVPQVTVDKGPATTQGTVKKKRPVITHIAIETDGTGRWYYCQVCKKKFHTRSMVSYHAYCNGQPKPYKCQECNKGFRTLSHYRYHMHVHRQDKKHTCKLCGASFYEKSKLQRHNQLRHTKERPHACSQCGATFASRTALRRHARQHSGARPFACAVCARQFRDQSNYRKHILRHDQGTDPKSRPQLKYPCPLCSSSFSTSKDLRRHNATHSDEKPFHCLLCGRRFQRKDNLERHIRNTHSDVDVHCAVANDNRPDQPPPASNGHDAPQIPDDLEDDVVKARLEEMNPLPPMPLYEDIEPARDLNPTVKSKDILTKPDVLIETPEIETTIEEKIFTELEPVQQVDINIPKDVQNTEPTLVTQLSPEKAELLFSKPDNTVPVGWHIVNIYPGSDICEPIRLPMIELSPMPERTSVAEPTPLPMIEVSPLPDRTELTQVPTDAEKKSIFQANIARESVIFGPVKKSEKAKDVYVHKLKIANTFTSKDLPPIDPNKFRMIKSATSSLDVGPVPPVNLHVYKKILYPDTDESKQESEDATKMHWRVKMKSQISKQKDVKEEVYD